MPFCDAENTFSNAQAVTVTAASENIVDLGDGGIGDANLTCEGIVEESATATGAATVDFAVEMSDTSDFSSSETIYSSGAVSKDDLAAGSLAFRVRLGHLTKRYMRVYYTVATGPLTAGKFSARLLHGAQTAK